MSSARSCPSEFSSHCGRAPRAAAGDGVGLDGHQLASSVIFVAPPSIPTPMSSARRVGRELARDAALVQGDDPVGQRVDLVELGRDQQDGAPRLPSAPGSVARRTRSRRRRALASAGPPAAASGAESSSRARISFCWLPPDRVPAVDAMLRARTSNIWISRSASALILRMNMTPNPR